MTYKNLKLLIGAGRYEVDDMYNKLDLFLMVGRITVDEYIELTGMIEPEEVPVEPEPEEEPAEELVEEEPEVGLTGETESEPEETPEEIEDIEKV